MKHVEVRFVLILNEDQPVQDWIIDAVKENLDPITGEHILEYSDSEPVDGWEDSEQILRNWLKGNGYDSLHEWMLDSDWVWNPLGFYESDGNTTEDPVTVAWAAMEASQS